MVCGFETSCQPEFFVSHFSRFPTEFIQSFVYKILRIRACNMIAILSRHRLIQRLRCTLTKRNVMKCNEELVIINVIIEKKIAFFLNLKTDISTSLFSWSS